MKNLELKIKNTHQSKLTWLICSLFFLFFSAGLHSSPKTESKSTKVSVSQKINAATVTVNNYKVAPADAGKNTFNTSFSISFETTPVSITKIPAAFFSKKTRLLKFRHHLKPAEEEDARI